MYSYSSVFLIYIYILKLQTSVCLLQTETENGSLFSLVGKRKTCPSMQIGMLPNDNYNFSSWTAGTTSSCLDIGHIHPGTGSFDEIL
jgi:hypothetical protein